MITNEAALIKHMTERFLSWKLPANFAPDNGISFDPIANRGYQFESRREPVGTNLLTYAQAEAMVRHMLDGAPLPRGDAPLRGDINTMLGTPKSSGEF